MSHADTEKDPQEMPLQAKVEWQEGFHFLGTAPSGQTVDIDGDKVQGASPMELILLGLGGCASYDVISILKKSRQDISDVRCEVSAIRADSVPAVYTDVHLRFVVSGKDVRESQVAKAVQLSADKYCSVSKMLEAGGVNITHDFKIVTE